MFKATEFSKKQINVIYANVKSGNFKIEKWAMSQLYDLADYYGYDDNRSVEESERKIKDILEVTFSKDYKKAQEKIDYFTDDYFKSMSRKNQEASDRSYL